jgi:hypothetical protein
MGIRIAYQRQVAAMCQVQGAPIAVEPGRIEVAILNSIEHVKIFREQLTQRGRPGKERVRGDHETLGPLSSADIAKGAQTLKGMREIVQQNMASPDCGFDARDQNDPPISGITGEG